MTFYGVLVLGHILGSCLGVMGATLAEVIRVGMHRRPYKATRVSFSLMGNSHAAQYMGAALTVATGIGFVLHFVATGDYVYLQSEMFWAKLCMLAIISLTTYALSSKRISYYYGSALLLASWWLALCAGFFLSNDMHLIVGNPLASFFLTLALYGAATVSLAALLQLMRSHVTPHAVYDTKAARLSSVT